MTNSASGFGGLADIRSEHSGEAHPLIIEGADGARDRRGVAVGELGRDGRLHDPAGSKGPHRRRNRTNEMQMSNVQTSLQHGYFFFLGPRILGSFLPSGPIISAAVLRFFLTGSPSGPSAGGAGVVRFGVFGVVEGRSSSSCGSRVVAVGVVKKSKASARLVSTARWNRRGTNPDRLPIRSCLPSCPLVRASRARAPPPPPCALVSRQRPFVRPRPP